MSIILAIITVLGLVLFFTGFSELPKQVRQSLNPQEIELYEQEMVYRQIWGLLLLAIPTVVLLIYLIFYF
jgi:Na+/H+ antiporter NhaC